MCCKRMRMRLRPAIIDKRLLEYVARKYDRPVSEIFNDPKITMFPEKSLEDRKNEKLLFGILKTLPDWGVGRYFTFKQDMPNLNDPPTFWQDFDYGVAWGVHTWKGWCEEYEKEIPRVNRHGWRLIPKLDEQRFLNYAPQSRETKEVPMYFRPPPLLSLLFKEENMKKGKNSRDVDEKPMIRLLLDRNRECVERQRAKDGTLV